MRCGTSWLKDTEMVRAHLARATTPGTVQNADVALTRPWVFLALGTGIRGGVHI